MKKIVALVLCLCLMLGCACASASSFEDLQKLLRDGSEETETTEAAESAEATESTEVTESTEGAGTGDVIAPVAVSAAVAQGGVSLTAECADGLKLVDHNVIALDEEYSSYIYVYIYLELTNEGSDAVKVDGAYEVLDTADAIQGTQDYLRAYPSVIAPGETAYACDYIMIEKGAAVPDAASIAQVKVKLNRSAYSSGSEPYTHVESSAQIGTGVDDWGYDVSNLYCVSVVNNSGRDLADPGVAVGLYDAAGKLVCAAAAETYCAGTLLIPAGGSFKVQDAVAYDISERLAQQGITITTIRSIAYGE